ncbi:MAG: hypothetical protein ACI4NG_00540 [Candidatus Gallimonas sp.]
MIHEEIDLYEYFSVPQNVATARKIQAGVSPTGEPVGKACHERNGAGQVACGNAVGRRRGMARVKKIRRGSNA